MGPPPGPTAPPGSWLTLALVVWAAAVVVGHLHGGEAVGAGRRLCLWARARLHTDDAVALAGGLRAVGHGPGLASLWKDSSQPRDTAVPPRGEPQETRMGPALSTPRSTLFLTQGLPHWNSTPNPHTLPAAWCHRSLAHPRGHPVSAGCMHSWVPGWHPPQQPCGTRTGTFPAVSLHPPAGDWLSRPQPHWKDAEGPCTSL